MNTIVFVGEHAKTYDVRWHTHDYWELVYCTGGEGGFKFDNGTSIHYAEGDTVAIPPRVVHANSSQEGFTNIHMRMEDPSFPYKTAFRVHDDPERHLKVAFEQAKYYFLADIKRCDLVLTALGDLISSYVVVYRSNSEFSDAVDQIRKTILSHYAEPGFALDEAIKGLPFSYDYLRKLFKKEVGITPLEYMTKLRMRKAETMLTAKWTMDYSIVEVARLCGYEDSLYFSRVFKKYFGISPSAFAARNNAAVLEEL